jgi:hypothetical protein
MKKVLLFAGLVFLTPVGLVGCGPEGDTAADTEAVTNGSSATDQGTLEVVANGESFVQEGFVTKDGWQVDFDHVYITLDDVTAYQTDPPFDPDQAAEPEATETITVLEEPETVDLAGEAATPVVATATAPKGNYNALSWDVVPAESGEAAGSTIVLDGTAQKDGRTIDFVMSFDQPLSYTCGQFVGDERKGMLMNTDEAELEATFHFDHIFGDGDAPADDAINTGAVGFDPFANLATGETLEADSAQLEAQLDQETYTNLQKAIAGLGHVGEGHCRLSGEGLDHTHSSQQ